jgi:hypothetical protein
MSKVRKLAWAAGVLAVLAVGPGCAMFDDYDDQDGYGSQYPAGGLPGPQESGARPAAGQPAGQPMGQPGVYNDARR